MKERINKFICKVFGHQSLCWYEPTASGYIVGHMFCFRCGYKFDIFNGPSDTSAEGMAAESLWGDKE